MYVIMMDKVLKYEICSRRCARGVAREEKRMGNIQYNWDQLIKEIKKIRSEYDRAVKSKYQGRPLVLTQKQYFENNKIIARGLVRWECIRRNEQFRQLCDGDSKRLFLGKDIVLTSQSTKSQLSNELAKIKTRIGKDKSVFFASRKNEHRYTAYFYFLKNLGHPPFLANSPVYSKQLHALFYDLFDKKDIKKLSPEQVAGFIAQVPRRVEFAVDFGYAKQEIVDSFEKQIDMWFRLNDAINARNTNRALDYSNIQRYLKIYDEKQDKSNLTFADLAQKYYPGAASKNLDSAIQQVKREYKRAKELINGGFVFIK